MRITLAWCAEISVPPRLYEGPDPSPSFVKTLAVTTLSHKGKLASPLAARLIGRRPLITFVTLAELTEWAEIRHWGARSRQELADCVSKILVLPGDEPVAATWGRLAAAAAQRGRPRPVNDMWVAACCLTYDLPLATLNLKDYEDLRIHHGLRILGTD